MQNVYLLTFDWGEYSDRETGTIAVFGTRKKAEKALEDIKVHKKEVDAWSNARLSACADAGYGRRQDVLDTKWWQKRQKWWIQWTEDNPEPTLDLLDDSHYFLAHDTEYAIEKWPVK